MQFTKAESAADVADAPPASHIPFKSRLPHGEATAV